MYPLPMNQQPFREYHLFQILSFYDENPFPLDFLLRNYFKNNHAAGAKDRKFICEAIYSMIRWKSLLDYLNKDVPAQNRWKSRFESHLNFSPTTHLENMSIPAHIRVSFPQTFFDFLEMSLGKEKAWEFCKVSNETAPTTVRANLLKTTREALLAKWKGAYQVSPCQHSPSGIVFHKKENFFAMPEFKEGLFEVQDEASQLIADLVSPKGRDQVLDFCAGSGGKTLAFAPKARGKGQIFVHDIRPSILAEAKKRLKRAGIQNAQVLMPDSPTKPLLKNKMNWILVDAPCTGTGTLRRNPDMKWKFEPEMVFRLVEEQRKIFEEALSYLDPKGHIVYSTCSVLPQENEEQLEYFQKTFNLELVQPILKTFPQSGCMDGFFGAVLRFAKPPEVSSRL